MSATKFSTLRKAIISNLDNPDTPFWRGIVLLLLTLIYISIVLLIIEWRYPDLSEQYRNTIETFNIIILSVFATELVVRIICYDRPMLYLLSWMGIIDVLAVVPGILAMIVPMAPNLQWLRSLRILRFARMLKFLRVSSSGAGVFRGITGKILPWVALGIGIKGALVALEGQPWWPAFGDLSILLGVSGFVLGMMLGMKLNMCLRRLYDIEDTLARIVGALRDMAGLRAEVRESSLGWAVALHRALRGTDPAEYWIAKRRTQELEERLEREGIGGPAAANFHRDVEFILHRAVTKMPLAYENFLKLAVVSYVPVVMIAIPGITRFFALTLIIYVLGGSYYLVDDMDHPMERGEGSLVMVDLAPLEDWMAMNATSKELVHSEKEDIDWSNRLKAEAEASFSPSEREYG